MNGLALGDYTVSQDLDLKDLLTHIRVLLVRGLLWPKPLQRRTLIRGLHIDL